MADLFDKTRKPTSAAQPASEKPTGGRDLFGNAAKAIPAPQRQANSGVISDKAAAELKASAAEAAEKVKAGAGKLADQAGELASKAKSTWVPAVKDKVSGVHVPRKTWALGAAVVLAAAIGAYAWHSHTTSPTSPSAAPAVESSSLTQAPTVPATAQVATPVPKVYGWNVAAGMKVLSHDTGPKQAFTCNLSFNADVGGGWSHEALNIPGFIVALDATHAVIKASTADVAQQALASSNFVLTAKCLTPEQIQAQAQAKPPVAPVEAPKAAPLPVFLPAKAPAPVQPAPIAAPVAVTVAKPTPEPAAPAPVTVLKPVAKSTVAKAKPQAKPATKPDNFEKDADAKLDAFFKQH